MLYIILYFQGTPLEEAKKILLMCLNHMKKDWTFNILVFGSSKSYYQHINTCWSCMSRGLGNTYRCKGMILACWLNNIQLFSIYFSDKSIRQNVCYKLLASRISLKRLQILKHYRTFFWLLLYSIFCNLQRRTKSFRLLVDGAKCCFYWFEVTYNFL